MSSQKGILYLIPTLLGDSKAELSLPADLKSILNSISGFIVENERSARRFLRKAGYTGSLDDDKLFPLNKHTSDSEAQAFLDIAKRGERMGLLSEAGCPAVADPGASIVSIAHESGIKVIPIVGPSSIILALMASGFNGQQFVFHGYIPKERKDRITKIKAMEKSCHQLKQTQIFIETPFRNNHIIEDLVDNCSPETRLCIACDLTLPDEFVLSKPIRYWAKNKPNLNKRPTVFLIG